MFGGELLMLIVRFRYVRVFDKFSDALPIVFVML
jgi:hypothetical protein